MARGRLTAALVALLVICVAGGGAGAYFLGRHRAEAAALGGQQSPAPTSITQRTPSEAGRVPAPTSSSTGGARSPTVVGTAPMSPPASPVITTSGRPLEDTTVVLVGAAANDDPQRAAIRDLLQKHFDSINSRNYQGWKDTVTQPEGGKLTEAAWQQAYGTTHDTDISVIAITAQPRQAQVTFRSRQAAAQAPDKKSTCLNWRITVSLEVQDDGSLLIGRSLANTAGWQPCYSG